MKNKLILCSLVPFLLYSSFADSDAKFVKGYNDGLTTYVIINSNGRQYRTDQVGSKINAKIWGELSADDKKKLMEFYYKPGDRIADFGSASSSMAIWANDTQGWSELIEKLKQKRANKDYPALKSFYEKPFKIPVMENVQCTEQIYNSDLAKESRKLAADTEENYIAGKKIYNKLVNVKWGQVSAAVKGISANLIPVITDNFMTGFIVNGASHASQLLANLYSFFQATRDFAKNSPNDSAELVKRLDMLCDRMKDAATTAKDLVEQDVQKLENNYKKLSELCEEDYKNKQKFEQEKKESLAGLLKVPSIDTGLSIISNAKEKEEREREICNTANGIYTSLTRSTDSLYNKTRSELKGLVGEYDSVAKPRGTSGCNYSYPVSVESGCFGMGYSVREIEKWKEDFPRAISEVNEKLDSDIEIFKLAKNLRSTYASKGKLLQARKNELIKKYRKCFSSIGESGMTVPDLYIINANRRQESLNGFIDRLEREIEKLKIDRSNLVNAQMIVKKGLHNRVEKEINGIKPYKSLESNFINSLSQIRDAIRKLDKIYLSEEIFTLDHHYPRYKDGLEAFKKKVSLLPEQSDKDKKINDLIKRLKEKQPEIRHQIKRLIIGQNNARDDLQKLNEFLIGYTGQGYNFSDKLKQDVKEVTGVTLKSPYYDIVKDWENGDAMLWMQGKTGNWVLKPQHLYVDIDSIIQELEGGESASSLKQLWNDLTRNEPGLLALDSAAWSKRFNEYSAQAYKLLQLSDASGSINSDAQSIYSKIYNFLFKIDNIIVTRDRVKKVYPVLQKDINDAKELLAKNEAVGFEKMIKRLQEDTKEGSDAYLARLSPELAPMFEEINKLSILLHEAEQELAVKANNNQQKIIQDFYRSFKEAYESKDISAVTSLLSDDWSTSSDDVDITDLEGYLSNSFNVFDEIDYNISNLIIQPFGGNKIKTSYNINIVGQIFDDDITHEEKSSVVELLKVTNGVVKIEKTLNGRFWSIK